MLRAARITFLAVPAPLVGFAAGTAAFQYWLGLDAAKERFPTASVSWSDVMGGAAITGIWALLLLFSRAGLTAQAILSVAALAIADLTFWVGVNQLIVL